MCGARGEDRSTNDAPLFLYLAATIFSGRFAVRLTIAGNYLPLPPRARRDPTRALLAVALWRHRRLASDPLSPFYFPVSLRDRSCTIEDERHRRRSATTSCSFCPSRSTTSLVCLRRLCICACTRALPSYTHTTRTRARARALPCIYNTHAMVSAGTTPGHPRRIRRGRENT